MTPYDADERWDFVPGWRMTAPPDQCEECRTPPGCEHNEGCEHRTAETLMLNTDREWVSIPLWKQAQLYGERVNGVLDNLQAMLAPGSMYRERIIQLGFDRLIENHPIHDSTMWNWDKATRDEEADQELADWACYKVSEG